MRDVIAVKNLLDTTLSDLLKGSLSKNVIAFRLLNIVRSGSFASSSRDELIIKLLKLEPKELKLREEEYVSEWVDMRFHHLGLGNVKKYGLTSSGKPYGISFSLNNQPVHSVFLGSNGIGKTSLFAALEYFGMKKMNTAKIRGYEREIGQDVNVRGGGEKPEKDQSEFLCHVEKNLSDVSITVKTNNGDYNLRGDRYDRELPKFVTEAFYCSDFDVRQLEKSDDFTDFFVVQLGLSEYVRALELLYALGKYVSTKRNNLSEIALLNRGDNADDVVIAKALLGISLRLSRSKSYYLVELLAEASNLSGLVKALKDNNNIDRLEVITDAEDVLIKEQKAFRTLDVYGKEICKRYSEVIKSLRIFKRVDYQISERELSDLSKFLVIRNTLCQEAIMLKIEKSVSPSRIFDIQERYMKRYVKALETHEQVKGEQKTISDSIADPEAQSVFDRDYLQLLHALECELSKKLDYWKSRIKKWIENLLNEYFLPDNDAVEIKIKVTPVEIEDGYSHKQVLISQYSDRSRSLSDFLSFKIIIWSCKGDLNSKAKDRVETVPRSYLNTFKYKLFCVALKLALVVVLKRIYKINYPFIIDDVFDASDFSSRLDLKDFMNNLVQMHDSMPGSGFKDVPLQLIFFTQDDVIARQVEKGLISACGRSQVKFGHIFDYHEATEEGDGVYKEDSEGKRELIYVSLEDDIAK